jgi:hypothetical protein
LKTLLRVEIEGKLTKNFFFLWTKKYTVVALKSSKSLKRLLKKKIKTKQKCRNSLYEFLVLYMLFSFGMCGVFRSWVPTLLVERGQLDDEEAKLVIVAAGYTLPAFQFIMVFFGDNVVIII